MLLHEMSFLVYKSSKNSTRMEIEKKIGTVLDTNI